MYRLFATTLALVSAADGILLIDEIENGLHYSVQLDMWRLIFRTARELNVQVFATTHSWDCISAFQKAASEDHASEGMLIRLARRNDEIIPTLFDERRLEIATQDQIEIR
jgi:AAA15 family ATPase/GTPase